MVRSLVPPLDVAKARDWTEWSHYFGGVSVLLTSTTYMS